MPSLKSIRTQIASKKSTQKITRAMKLVSAAKLRGAQDAILAARPYANALVEAIAQVAARAGAEDHPLLERREPKRITLVPITSDRGLAGGFNANIIRAVAKFYSDQTSADPGTQLNLVIVGKKGRDYYRRRPVTIKHEIPGATGATAGEVARQVATIVVDAFVNGQTDAVYLIYNEFKSAVQQRVVFEPLLPVTASQVLSAGPAHASAEIRVIDFAYEPTKRELLDALLPQFVESQVYRALLESVASEFGARMTAMENATNNAKEMIAGLTLKYNRARQAAITKELMEIVSGAEALKG
jgi:F-type H+-transporting ATPase subunit gamma